MINRLMNEFYNCGGGWGVGGRSPLKPPQWLDEERRKGGE